MDGQRFEGIKCRVYGVAGSATRGAEVGWISPSARRISDGRVLRLIKQWLEVAVIELIDRKCQCRLKTDPLGHNAAFRAAHAAPGVTRGNQCSYSSGFVYSGHRPADRLLAQYHATPHHIQALRQPVVYGRARSAWASLRL